MTKKIALLTAVSSKLGSYIARQLHSKNFQIIAHYHINDTKAKTLLYENVLQEIFQADFSNFECVDNLIERIFQTYPKIDLLVNSASIFEFDTAKDFKAENLENHLYINALAGIRLIQQIACRQQTTLKVVNILDVMTKKLTKKYFSYNLSKRLLLQGGKLLQASSLDVKIKNIYLPNITDPDDLNKFRFYF